MLNNPKIRCDRCGKIIALNDPSPSVKCSCSLVICTSCGYNIHPGLSCFYNLSILNYQIIDLDQAPIIQDLQPLLNSELTKVQNHFNKSRSIFAFFKAFLIVNKALEERYLAKKNAMADQCGGVDKVNEVLMWHGSAVGNYESIMRDGLKVGGVDGIPVVNGDGCGYGIYAGKNFSTVIGCAQDSKKVILFQGLLGNNSPSPIFIPSLLDNGSTHSYTNGEISVFFTKEQVIPRYLVEYT